MDLWHLYDSGYVHGPSAMSVEDAKMMTDAGAYVTSFEEAPTEEQVQQALNPKEES